MLLVDGLFAYIFHLTYFQRSLAFETINKLDNALQDINKCIELENKYEQAYELKARILNQKGSDLIHSKTFQAIACFSEAISCLHFIITVHLYMYLWEIIDT